ncbi:unnamed protein product [Effrenium voratum]|nr:unnamed protein product [Effrenium voratum]
MLRQPLAWAAVLVALIAAERVHQVLWERGWDVLPFPDSCDKLVSGGFHVPREGVRLQDCTIGAGTELEIQLDGPLIVDGSLTVRGRASFRARSEPFQEACLQVKDGLTISGRLEIYGCHNDANDDEGRGDVIGGCLNATSLSMEDGNWSLKNCSSKGAGGCAALGSLHQRAGKMDFTKCNAKIGGGLYVAGDLAQAGGEMMFEECSASELGGGLNAGTLSTNGWTRFDECKALGGAGAFVHGALHQGPAGSLSCVFCRAQGFGGCLGVHRGGIAAEGRVLAFEVFGGDGASIAEASKHPMFHEQLTPAMRANGASAVAAFKGPAAFHKLIIAQQDKIGLAVAVDGLLAAQELTVSEGAPAGVVAWEFDVKSANCETAICAFMLNSSSSNSEHNFSALGVWPRCRAGSEVSNMRKKVGPGVVARGCDKCSAGYFQLQRNVSASCTKCPEHWKLCDIDKLEMFPRWMAPIDPEKLELNPTREGRALQCLSEAACPGGRLQQDAVKPMCSEGRTGVLCAACTTEYYATKGECKRCTEVSQEDKLHLWGIAAGVAAIGLGLAGMAWLSRGAATEYWQQADVQWHVLKELAARQAVVLLQVVQLYGVLAALVPDPSTGQGARESFWERTYVDALQLNLAQAQDAFRFQCLWDGDKVRLVFALASPIVPLVLLLACVLLEIIKPSMGGATLDDFAFLQKLPFLPCSKTGGVAKWVYAVGYGTGAVYVAVIPAALLFLYMRQHIVLKPSKTITAQAKRAKSSWITKLRSVKASEPMQVNDEHLLAAAVAHMVVTFQGKVWLQLQGGKAEMKSSEREGRAPAELTVSSFLEDRDEVEEMLRSRAIMEMLVERCEMEKASEKNRALAAQIRHIGQQCEEF